ncbi:MAG: type transport system permease protein, partial [Nocardioidaceae bacterium]|nr:type transport system permease protein [Nocardioidaceae bacterium]
LPSGALGQAMRAALVNGDVAWSRLLALLACAVVGSLATARTFKWE